MKRLLIYFFCVFVCLTTYGQFPHVGKIIYMPNPCDTFPCMSGMVYCLEINSGDFFFLTKNRHLICSDEQFTVDNTTYSANDVVLLERELFVNGCDDTITAYPVYDIKTI